MGLAANSADWMARSPVRFVLLGGANTLLTWAFFAILVAWLPHQTSLILAYALGVVIAWLGNSRWVFQARPGRMQVVVYPLIYLTIWLVNAGILEWLVTIREIGPRLSQALALFVIVPLSFTLNAALLDARRPNRINLALTLLPALAVTFAVLWPVLGGYWLGDDLSNIYRVWELDHQHRLVTGTLAFLVNPVDSVGAFYRPGMMASISGLYVLFGDWYPGWAAASLLMHLVNTCLVVLIIRRLLAWTDWSETGATGQMPILVPALAALTFALCPLLLEGVVWVSARSDAAVTLFSLAGVWLWMARPGSNARLGAWALPLLMIPALGFKESAVIVPLQVLLLAVVWPGKIGTHRLAALLAAGMLAVLFLAMRTWLFGDPTEVYVGATPGAGMLASLPAWFLALFSTSLALAWLWLISLMVLIGLVLALCRGQSLRFSLALMAAGAGLALATLLNLGALAAAGEGGRLAYGPIAWLVAGIGLGLSASMPRALPLALLAVCVLTSAVLTRQQLGHYRHVQDGIAELMDILPEHADQHPGLTLLLVPDRVDFVVAFRNAQGGLVMPPLQDRPMLHRILPTLPGEIELREQQLSDGLATRLRDIQPQTLEPNIMQALFEPTDATPIDHLACWDARQRRLVVIDDPEPDWPGAIRARPDICPP